MWLPATQLAAILRGLVWLVLFAVRTLWDWHMLLEVCTHVHVVETQQQVMLELCK